MGGFWDLLGCLGGRVGGLVFQKHLKNNIRCMFSKSFDIAMFALLEWFGRPSWFISGRLDPPKRSKNHGWATLIVPKGGGYLGTIRPLEAL